MFQLRIHGRGGQGVVTHAELLAHAVFIEGRHAQAFPTFGSERTGAPVVAFCRIDEHPIRIREPIAEPDAVIVQDPTLLHQVDLFGGLSPGGRVLLNTERTVAEMGISELAERIPAERIATVPASAIALRHVGRPLPNAPLLGAFAALTALVSAQSVETAIRARFPGEVGEQNAAAAREALGFVREEITAVAGGPAGA